MRFTLTNGNFGGSYRCRPFHFLSAPPPNVPRSAEESGKVTEVRLSGNMYKERSMSSEAILGLSILMSFIAFSIVTRLYIWPKLLVMRREDALITLVVPHTFRFVGLSFLVPGVVSPSLSAAFAKPAAYGDLAAAVLAVVAILALVARASWAIPIVWVFNLWGTVDLLHAIYQGQIGVGIDPGSLGATFFIPTLVVPPLLVMHGLIFWLLLRPRQSSRPPDGIDDRRSGRLC